MANGTPVSLPVGIDQDYQISLLDEYGQAQVFDDSDTPYAMVWSGLDTPIVLTPTCTWTDSATGKFTLTVAGSDTIAIAPGKYRLRYGVTTAAGRTVAAPDTFIEFTSSPGQQTALTSYCSFQDLKDFAPWVQTLQDAEDETGFARERNRARQWLERVIQRHNYGTYWNDMAIPLFGYSVGATYSNYNWGQTDPVLQGWLDDDLLRVNEQVTEITAKYTLYLICNAQLADGATKTNWQQMGQEWYADAQRLVKGYSAEIYLTDNSIAPIKVIPCGRISMR